jgi:predicted AAA+ superfamily ATPase
MYKRNIESELQSAIADTPVILLNGARQTGKTTWAREFAKVQSIPLLTSLWMMQHN